MFEANSRSHSRLEAHDRPGAHGSAEADGRPETRGHPRGGVTPRTLLRLVALVAIAPACADPDPTPPAAEELTGGPDEGAAVTPARYLTEVAFIPAHPTGTPLLIRGVNAISPSAGSSSPGGLSRDYRIQLFDGTGIGAPLVIRDTLPVPRAAWRLLPAPGLKLRVGEAGEPVGFEIATASETLRIRRGAPVAEWTGTTGQRESLARAHREGSTRPGLLLLRRAARGGDAPPPRDAERVVLLGDSAGHALVLVQSTTAGDSAAAWVWLPETRGAWMDVTLAPAGEGEAVRTAGPSEGWRVLIPAAGVEGTIRVFRAPDGEARGRIGGADPPGPTGGAATGVGRTGAEGTRLTAELRTESGSTLRLHGLTWLSRLP